MQGNLPDTQRVQVSRARRVALLQFAQQMLRLESDLSGAHWHRARMLRQCGVQDFGRVEFVATRSPAGRIARAAGSAADDLHSPGSGRRAPSGPTGFRASRLPSPWNPIGTGEVTTGACFKCSVGTPRHHLADPPAFSPFNHSSIARGPPGPGRQPSGRRPSGRWRRLRAVPSRRSVRRLHVRSSAPAGTAAGTTPGVT